jgi:hypothetical protein
MGAFRKTRNVELSVVQFVEEAIAASWSGITVVKSFVQAYNVPLPVICVRMSDIYTGRLEIGSQTLAQEYTISVDVFASSDGQRLDLVDFLTESIKAGMDYYEYSSVSGSETLSKTKTGKVRIVSFDSSSKIDPSPSSVEQDKFRHYLSFTVSA